MKKVGLIQFGLALIFATLLSVSSAQNNNWAQKTADEMARVMRLSWGNVSKVWKGADYRRYHVLYTDGTIGWHIDGTGTIVRQQPLANFQLSQPVLGNSVFGYSRIIEVDSIPTIVMWSYPTQVPEQLAEVLVGLIPTTAVHELFHFVEQSKASWAGFQKLPKGLRSESYPAAKQARLMRYELAQALRRAIVEPNKRLEHLQAASYWNNLWNKEFSAEATRIFFTDIAEGTARYFDAMVEFRLKNGFDLPLNQLQMALSNTLNLPQYTKTWGFGLDAEAYDLGFFAGVLLELSADQNWQQVMQDGQATPVNHLLKNIQPTPQEFSPEGQTLFETWTNRFEPARRNAIEPMISRYADVTNPLVVLKINWIGSFSMASGFALSEQLPAQALLSVSGRAQGNNGVLTLRNSSFMEVPKEVLELCTANQDSAARYILVPWKNQAPDAAGVLQLNDFGFQGSVKVTKTQTSSQRTVYCGV